MSGPSSVAKYDRTDTGSTQELGGLELVQGLKLGMTSSEPEGWSSRSAPPSTGHTHFGAAEEGARNAATGQCQGYRQTRDAWRVSRYHCALYHEPVQIPACAAL